MPDTSPRGAVFFADENPNRSDAMSNVDAWQDMATIANCLADAKRTKLLSALSEGHLTANQIAAVMQLQPSAVSYQLRVLTEAGMVLRRRGESDTREIYYRLNHRAIERFTAGIAAHILCPTSESLPDAVLFVCRGNSARSQMAEAWTRHLSDNIIFVMSAGIEPSDVHPLTQAVMAEVNVDITKHKAKRVTEIPEIPDLVISVCDVTRDEVSRHFGGIQHRHWSIPDPVPNGDIADFRMARDVINAYVQRMITRWNSANDVLAG
jgi:ArsR family transcriptional regulator